MKKVILFCVVFFFCHESVFAQKVRDVRSTGNQIDSAINPGTFWGGNGNTTTTTSSSNREVCGTLSLKEQIALNPSLRNQIQTDLANIFNDRRKTNSGVPVRNIIPVVFHVINDTHDSGVDDESNISDARILNALETLNNDFKGLTLNDPVIEEISGAFTFENRHIADDYTIDFRLAEKDQFGAPTTGINYYGINDFYFHFFGSGDCMYPDAPIVNGVACLNSYINVRENSAYIANQDNPNIPGIQSIAWPSDQYLNIYILRFLGEGNDYAGYSINPFALGDPNHADGVFLAHYALDPNNSPYIPSSLTAQSLSHTLTHEVGHWLGLEHMWGSELSCSDDDFQIFKNNTDVLTDEEIDDMFNDTPPTNKNYNNDNDCDLDDDASCDSETNMYDNFMYYGGCRATYSKGQVDFMELILKSDLTNAKRGNLHSMTNLQSVFNCVDPMPIDINLVVSGHDFVNLNAPNYAGETVSYAFRVWNSGSPFGQQTSDMAHVDGSDIVTIPNMIPCTPYIITMYYHCQYDNSYRIVERVVQAGGATCKTNETRENKKMLSDQKNLNVYPNPAQGLFTVNLENGELENVNQFLIADIAGRKMQLDYRQIGAYAIEFSTTNLEKGYYILTVVFHDGTKSSTKLIIN